MIFASIDPGAVNASIAVFEDHQALFVDDLLTAGGMIDAVALARILDDRKVEHVVCERVAAMPKQGVTSAFRFGMGCGIIHGVAGALRLPLTLVAPTQWKKYFNLSSDKELSRTLAIRTWPELNDRLERRKDHGRAEALLLGKWFAIRTISREAA